MLSQETKEKLILHWLGLNKSAIQNDEPPSPTIGKVCMVRTYSAGVHFGEVVSRHGTNVVLKNARRIHYWAAACSLSQLAMDGDQKIDDCRITVPVDLIELTEAIEIIPMSEQAIKILDVTTWEK